MVFTFSLEDEKIDERNALSKSRFLYVLRRKNVRHVDDYVQFVRWRY